MEFLEKREQEIVEVSNKFFGDINFLELEKANFPSADTKAAWSGNIRCGEKDVGIIVSLPEDFPDVLPKIYLAKDNVLPVIPHVDGNAFICVYPSNVVFFSENVEGMLSDTIEKARRVLMDGLSGINQKDFVDEMLAYWGVGSTFSVYSNFDPEITNTNLVLASFTTQTKKVIRLITEDKEASTKIALKLKLNYKALEVSPVLYLPNLPPFIPPFPETNSELFSLLDGIDPKLSENILSFLDKRTFKGYVVFSTLINGERVFAGWSHQGQKTKEIYHGGFRIDHIDAQILKSRIANGSIYRFEMARLDSKRIHNRVGVDHQDLKDKTVCVVGCGSIGSKLAFNLIREGVGKLILIDNENLLLENVGRHLCGISGLNKSKVIAVRDKIIDHYPDSDVVCIETTFNQAYGEHRELIIGSNLVISCTANLGFERTLNKLYHSIDGFPSIQYVWTEPYGIACHSLITVDRTTGCFECCFDPVELRFYKEVIISPDETFLRNEAGCQASFVPYSSLDVEQAASLATRMALNSLHGGLNHNIGMTYFGDLSKVEVYKLDLSEGNIKSDPFSNTVFDLPKRDDCGVCKHGPSRP